MKRSFLAISTVLVLINGCVSSTQAPAGPPIATAPVESRSIPLDPAVQHGKLENGLTFYVRANHKPEKRASLRLVVNAGSVLEDDDQRGIAHFVEHMAFNGTEHFEKQELVNYLERIGMRFGPDINAYTSFDETVYMLEIPTDDPEIMKTAFQILRDWAGGVSFAPEEVEKERGVVIEEWRLGRGAGERIQDKQFPLLFHGSRYADRLPIGKKEILQGVSRERLLDYYRDWYRPDLMAIVAVGDFDASVVERMIREHFKSIPRATTPRPRQEFLVPDHEQTLVSIVTDPEATESDVRVEYKRPRLSNDTVEDFRRSLVDNIYDAMLGDRLRELTTRGDPPFQFGAAGSSSLGRTKSSYSLYASVRDGGVERGLATLLTEARRVEKHGFAASELERAKTEWLRYVERYWEEREKLESNNFVGEYSQHFLEGEPFPSIDHFRELCRELVPGISLEEVNARSAQWLKGSRVILVSGPRKKEAAIPDERALLAVFDNVNALGVTPWVDQVRDEPLVAQRPAGGSIIEESVIEEIGVTRWKLSNGVVVQLKPTDFKNDELLLRGYSPGGTSLISDADYFAAGPVGAIAGFMGAGNFNRTELEKALTGKIAGVSSNVGQLSEGVNGIGSTKDIETMLQLVWLRMTGARKDEEAFSAFMTQMRGDLENEKAAPEYSFGRRFNELMTKDHPRARFLEIEDLDRIDLDRALAVYRDRFADASDFTFTIVGSFDLAKVRPLVERWLGGLPATRRAESWRDIGVDEPDGVVKFDVRKGIEPKSRVRITFHGDATWSVENQHLLGSMAEVLRIRLREEMREEMGGVYGVSVSGGISRWPDEEYRINVSFGCDPARVDELVATVFREIAKIKESGPIADHVDRVREAQTRKRETDLKLNWFWVQTLESSVVNGLDPRRVLEYGKLVESVTTESMQKTARRYLDESRYVMGVLYPEK